MLLNHHILAKKSTDAVLSKFKTGEWHCCGERGIGFYRAGCNSDFPSPDAMFSDTPDDFVVSFEFKPPTETKRGILTGLGQSLAYLSFSDISFLLVPEYIDDFAIAEYMKGIYSSVLDGKIPAGLIAYRNDDPSDVRMLYNFEQRVERTISRKTVVNNRFWAKHVDMPVPLFHLILHYLYQKKSENKSWDAFAECWRKQMAPVAALQQLAPSPIKDVAGTIIHTLTGRKPLMYFETTIRRISKCPKRAREARIASMITSANPASTGDTMYNSVRKNCMPFMHHVGMIDSVGNLTDAGLKMYHLGMSNGPRSRIFNDYFMRMVLLNGHHIDLIYDLERLSCDYRGLKNAKEIKSLLLEDYVLRGMIKTNPGRCADPSLGRKKPFLADETRLWGSLGLMKKLSGAPEFAFDWQRITEVCNLPDL